MKLLIAALLICISFPLFACQEVAQFSGNVIKHTGNDLNCTFQIQFSRYDASVVCPLDIDESYFASFEDKNCSFRNGDTISGYLIKSAEDTIVIE